MDFAEFARECGWEFETFTLDVSDEEAWELWQDYGAPVG